MSFLLRPLCEHVTSNCCFVLTKGQGLSIEHDVDGLSDAEAKIFEGDRHGGEVEAQLRSSACDHVGWLLGFEGIQIGPQTMAGYACNSFDGKHSLSWSSAGGYPSGDGALRFQAEKPSECRLPACGFAGFQQCGQG